MTADTLFRALQRAVETSGAREYEVILDIPSDGRYQRIIDTRIDHEQHKVFLHGA